MCKHILSLEDLPFSTAVFEEVSVVTTCPLGSRVIRQVVHRDFPRSTVSILAKGITLRCTKDGGDGQGQHQSE